jgi:nicotinate-nucleotide pyrophosphorylase (carboxylating)
MKNLLTNPLVTTLIDLAFAEDIGSGDHTSLACIDKHAKGKSAIVAKETGVLAGVLLGEYIFKKVNPQLQVTVLVNDGTVVSPEQVVMEIEGSDISMLTAERTVLNFMQRLSGISTQTAKYVKELNGLHTKILDTRKTTPGMRLLEKWAVVNGGGANHRVGLYDMILIKDNHNDFAGGIRQAISKAKSYLLERQLNLAIEVETRNLKEVQDVLLIGGIQRIMLDNFTIPMLKEAVGMVNGIFETEASGGITIEKLRSYAETGVDYISSGALTHSIKSLDLSMRAIK